MRWPAGDGCTVPARFAGLALIRGLVRRSRPMRVEPARPQEPVQQCGSVHGQRPGHPGAPRTSRRTTTKAAAHPPAATQRDGSGRPSPRRVPALLHRFGGADGSVPPQPADPASSPGRARTVGTVALALAVVAGVVLRFVAPPALWLDEAQSVAIARSPLSGLFAGLREDGAPPLYYLLLHGWIGIFGQGAFAVRALSGLFSLAALPVAWALGRRLGGPRVATALVLLLATSPFAIRYS